MNIGKLLVGAALATGLMVSGATPGQAENELLGGLLGGAAGAGVGGAIGGGKGAAIGGVLGLGIGALGANQLSKPKQPEQPTYVAPPPPAYQQGYAPPPAYQQGYAPPPAPAQGYVPPPPPTTYQQGGQPQPAPAAHDAFDTSYCREYSTTTVIDGAEQKSHGTACRQADGTWRILN